MYHVMRSLKHIRKEFSISCLIRRRRDCLPALTDMPDKLVGINVSTVLEHTLICFDNERQYRNMKLPYHCIGKIAHACGCNDDRSLICVSLGGMYFLIITYHYGS